MASTSDQPTETVFEGFSSPQFTQTPNVFFDRLMPHLKEAELKVLLYIIRRTWGFAGKQDGDTISLNQLCNGIVNDRGERLDEGTGLSKAGAAKALLSLRTKGIITRIKNRDTVRGDTATTYRLRMLGEPLDASAEPPKRDADPLSTTVDTRVNSGGHPLSTSVDTPVHSRIQALSTDVDTQKKDVQQKDKRARSVEYSNNGHGIKNWDDDQLTILEYVQDYARELADQAPLASTHSRAVNLYRQSGVDLETFLSAMQTARAKTKLYSAGIKAEATGQGAWKSKPKVAYWFAILGDLLGVNEQKREIG